MRRPDLKMIEPGRLRGAGSGEAGVRCEVNEADDSRHGPMDTAQRRADTIRLQAIGQIGGGV